MTIAHLAPRFGVTGERLDILAKALEDTTHETAKVLLTSNTAVIAAMIAVLAGLAAKIDRGACADYFHALSVLLRNATTPSELDRRRVDRCAAALFEAEHRRAQG